MVTGRTLRVDLVAVVMLLSALLMSVAGGPVCGCASMIHDREDRSRIDLGPAVLDPSVANSASYRDTIGSLAFYQGTGPLEVRGYGLVIGLGRNGSRTCPDGIYERLVQEMYKRQGQTSLFVGEKKVTPEAMIDDLDTAVVWVRGLIPAAAIAGSPIDLAIGVIPGTETKSLQGGLLLPTELKIVKTVSPSKSLTGQTLVMASGRVFMNPFSKRGDKATARRPDRTNPPQATLLGGTLLGGGRVLNDRPMRLTLTHPSYVRARRIQDRINAQFPGRYRVADATSPSTIKLRVPEEYRANVGHFLALVRALFLSRDPRFAAARARQLGEELLNPSAPHARIALCLQGLGQTALPVVEDLYAHSMESVSFHAAVAGLRLGDHIGGDAVAVHAQRLDGAFRFAAIRALGETTGMGGPAFALRQLLDDDDPRVRIAALEELLDRDDPSIARHRIGSRNFELVLVEGGPRNVVYVRKTAQRRIVLFGSNLRCSLPMMYRSSSGMLIATAGADDSLITVMRTAPAPGAVSPPVSVSPELPALIKLLGSDADVGYDGQVTGLGIDYGTVLHMLHYLSRHDSLNADFIVEQPNLADMVGPPRRIGRPESEL